MEENPAAPIEGTAITQAVTNGIDYGAFQFAVDKASVVHQGGYDLITKYHSINNELLRNKSL